MIRTFADPDTEATFRGETTRRIPADVRERARRKLERVDQAENVLELREPSGNRLEALHGDREGQFSIRINQQWRICFRFSEGDAFDVAIVDYH